MRFLPAVATAILAATMHAAAAPPDADAAHQGGVLIFAASSLKTALDAMTVPVQQATGISIRVSYASSAVLARQIENGAPADVFISADTDWMDYVDTRHLLRPNTRVNLLGNALVLIAPKDRPVSLRITPGFSLLAALGRGRLAVGETSAVPAGKYAKAALMHLGVWTSVQSRLAPAENVRAALRLVSAGEAPLGVVYATDAAADPSVVVVDTFPADSHPAIVYPAALVSRKGAETTRGPAVLDFLRSAQASAICRHYGFAIPGR
jgi:molybdate transport system substrate-binding protein